MEHIVGTLRNLVCVLYRIVHMQKFFSRTGSLVLALLLSSYAQVPKPASAPSDIVLSLGTDGDGRQFHLGELIPVKFAYSAKTPGRYLWVSQSSKLAGGRPLEISCSPSAERVSTQPSSASNGTFAQMLYGACGGVGGGVGGGCGDCDQEARVP